MKRRWRGRNITVEQLRDYTKAAILLGAGKMLKSSRFVVSLSERAYITGVTANIAGGKTRG